MTSAIVADPRELMGEHLAVLREYCKQVLIREDSLVADQEKDRERRMQELLAMGRSFSVTDKELWCRSSEDCWWANADVAVSPAGSGRRSRRVDPKVNFALCLRGLLNMLRHVDVGTRSLESYRSTVGGDVVEELYSVASCLKGARVAHINSTSNGGGVAEILWSLVPLYRDLGIDASWLVMEGDEPFFRVTKGMHNALQGSEVHFTQDDWDLYMACNERNARSLFSGYDVVFLHDPQPAAIRHFARDAASNWVWRCHIDLSEPDLETWDTLRELVNGFDAAVFSTSQFVRPDLGVPRVAIIPPAIDPHTRKNRPMSRKKAEAVVAQFGVDPRRPFVSQVSRFDPWKDPLGVIAAFGLLRERHPYLQLVLLGNFADDDPEGHVIYGQVMEAAAGYPDVHIITDLTDLVSPFQALSKVVIQKSVREGFGLTVTEALWKGTPVVAGKVGGIPLQIGDGVGGFLVESIEECAQKLDYLLSNGDERVALGEAGREHVRLNFLMPRLLHDELELVSGLLQRRPNTEFVSALAPAA